MHTPGPTSCLLFYLHSLPLTSLTHCLISSFHSQCLSPLGLVTCPRLVAPTGAPATLSVGDDGLFGACSLPQPRVRFSVPGPTLHHNAWGTIHPCIPSTLHQTPDDWFQAKKRVELTSIDAYFYLLYHVLHHYTMFCTYLTTI
ncbi:hypothetical protein AB205_0067250 [Aquarana catesbeiana]|uniref:Uncharacterized protein n=1 Tax=Aquarana catesbeiana TaxID=8400 RepID=A0A2G9QA89_AQUCT|nr:hypothetical protein AB205_0067250 [Aquarana catesbeiana]